MNAPDFTPGAPKASVTGPTHYRRGEALLEKAYATSEPVWMKAYAALAAAEFAAAQAAATGLIAATDRPPGRDNHGSVEWLYAVCPREAPAPPAAPAPPPPEPEPIPTWNPPAA